MKHIKKLFTCASVFALTACSGGLGQKISEERALEIAANLSNNYVRLASETKVEYKQTDAQDGYSIKETGTIRENLNGDIYCSVHQTENNKVKGHYEVYLVSNELYEEVCYIKDYVYDNSGKAVIKVVVKRNNGNYYLETRKYISRDDTIVYYDIKEMDCLTDLQDSISFAKREEDLEMSLYSKSSNDLSIKMISRDGGEQYYHGTSTMEEVFTYGRYGLTSVTSSEKDSDGSTLSYSQKTKYAQGFNIALPNGWQQYLNK